ncbi:hypothetical protein [Legionella cincinnatiensis]|uniref:Coiled coil protein n=1 Tax=Legionella cincinnatiensis TaxID=28085 RepID=A0A378ITW0_9GAMM|nr:hypothetical protein [Legionella cincinnatiensis]KTC89081.1 coiled coil protein [Legionella cincinnatiensis]STX35454.1 coiled coil protein [Legionella cincinnatiensis]
MTTELLEIASEAPQLTPLELETINQKLDNAIQLKQDSGELQLKQDTSELRLSSSESDMDPNPSSIDLSKYGLKNPEDIKIFLLTPAGETVIHEIGTEISLDRAREEELQFEIQQQILEQERIRAFLFHWLLEEEAEAQKIQDEIIMEQQEKVLNKNEHTPSTQPSKPKSDFNTTLRGYDSSIDKLSKEQRALSERIEKLEKEQQLLVEKYDDYEKSLDDFYESSHLYTNEEQINEDVAKLTKEKDEINETINVTDDPQEKHQLEHKLKKCDHKIRNLEDIRSVLKGEKRFADANGRFEDENGNPITFKNAAFVLSKNQKIEKEHDKCYLLEEGQTLSAMNEEEKTKSHQMYTHAKKDLQIVRHGLHDAKKEELQLNALQLARDKAEHRMLQNQINLMHAARAKLIQQALTPNTHLNVPQSTMTPQKVASINHPTAVSKPSPKPARPMQEVFGDFVKNAPKPMTWGMLFKFVEEIPNPKARNDANKVLVDQYQKEKDQELDQDPKNTKQKENLADILKHPEKFKAWLKNTLSAAPVPDATMQDLLKNMATNSQNPYDPDVTSLKSPLELQQDPQQEQSNTPMKQ